MQLCCRGDLDHQAHLLNMCLIHAAIAGCETATSMVVQELPVRELMNELEFKHHLKDLAEGHHHPEEHDWSQPAGQASKKVAAGSSPRAKRKPARKSSKRR